MPVVLINLDEFGYACPTPQDDPFHIRLRLKDLAAVWPTYQEVGVKALNYPVRHRKS